MLMRTLLSLGMLAALGWSARAAEPLTITGVEAPATARPGETVRVTVQTNAADPLALRFACAGRWQGPYAPVTVVERKGESAQSEALTGSLHTFLRFRLPAQTAGNPAAYPGYVLWVRGSAEWVVFKGYLPDGTVKENGFRLGDGGGLKWVKLLEYAPAGTYDSFTLSVAKGRGVDCVLASPDAAFHPLEYDPQGNLGLNSNVFFLTMPALLEGKQSFRVLAQRQGQVAQAAFTVEIRGENAPGRGGTPALATDAQWLPLQAVANLSAQAADAEILDEAAAAAGKLAVDGATLTFAPDKPAFAGVWKPVAEKTLQEKEVTVAQADDKVRTVQDLPEELRIPVGRIAPALAFVHAEKGAGELGDLLWEYVVCYRDGAETVVPVREGVAVSGLLKGEEIAQARLVWAGMTDGAPSKVYLFRWNNARPQEEIAAVRLRAVRKKIVPVLLGIAVEPSAATVAAPPVSPQTAEAPVAVEVNFAAVRRPVRRGLFSMNNPYLVTTKVDLGLRGMRMVRGEDSWNVYREMDYAYDRVWVGGWLPEAPEGEIRYDASFDNATLAMRRIGSETRTRLIVNLNPPKWSYSEEQGLEDRLRRVAALSAQLVDKLLQNGWPIEYVEIFNETLIRHPQPEVERKYRCFNAIAAALKKQRPQLRIAGTAECWPAVEVIEQFVRACGTHLDAVSWHLYPTGTTDSSNEMLMRHTAQMAKSSVLMETMLRRTLPGRQVPQLITEYNINYAAWKNGGELRQKNGIGAVWLFSALGHLLNEGEAEVANYWHYEFGKPYSIGSDPGARLSPMGQALLLLNRHMRGNMVQAATRSAEVECYASVGEEGTALILLNLTQQERPVRVCGWNSPFAMAKPGEREVRKYGMGGTATGVTCEVLDWARDLGQEFTVTLPAQSAAFYVLPTGRPVDRARR